MKTIGVKGMSCEHCVKNVEKALAGVPGVGDVKVDLKGGTADIEENEALDMAKVKEAIEKAGFEFGDAK
jgi:copper ion binding protein